MVHDGANFLRWVIGGRQNGAAQKTSMAARRRRDGQAVVLRDTHRQARSGVVRKAFDWCDAEKSGAGQIPKRGVHQRPVGQDVPRSFENDRSAAGVILFALRTMRDVEEASRIGHAALAFRELSHA